jgi:carbonic anhydrase/acetyltransferase-like protein (isoleucine patch superfamily)
MIEEVGGKKPRIHETAFIHQTAVVIGDVTIGAHASIWPGAVLRGDINPIIVGENTNIQDNCVLHTGSDGALVVEDNVLVGHCVTLHSCHIKEGCMVGIGAIVLDGTTIGEDCLVAAGTLVPPHKNIPKESVLMGTPARIVRTVTQKDREYQRQGVLHYCEEALRYLETEQV